MSSERRKSNEREHAALPPNSRQQKKLDGDMSGVSSGKATKKPVFRPAPRTAKAREASNKAPRPASSSKKIYYANKYVENDKAKREQAQA